MRKSTSRRAVRHTMQKTDLFASNIRLESAPSKGRRAKDVLRAITSVTSRAAFALGHISSAITRTEEMVGVAVFHLIQHRL